VVCDVSVFVWFFFFNPMATAVSTNLCIFRSDIESLTLKQLMEITAGGGGGGGWAGEGEIDARGESKQRG